MEREFYLLFLRLVVALLPFGAGVQQEELSGKLHGKQSPRAAQKSHSEVHYDG
jgi:hypothetical protein